MCFCFRRQTAMATASGRIAPVGAMTSRRKNSCCSNRSLAPILSHPSSSYSSLQRTRLNKGSLGVTRNCRVCSSESWNLCHSGKFVTEWWSYTRKGDRRGGRGWSARARARAQAGAGSSTMVAKEMERVAAKEALLLSIKDAGGLKGLSDPAANDKAKIDVNEKILNLERLNPTPRPTTSPVLEGLWQFEWAGARSPGIVAARTLLGRFPAALASIESLTLLILDGSAQARGFLKIFNTVESSFTLITKLTVEGPLRLKEEYVEGLLAMPTVRGGSIPSQLKGLVDQLNSVIERLPDTIKDLINGGVKVPLSGTFSRELLISYLDEEVLVARDKSGIPDVLLHLESQGTDINPDVIVPEYMS